jgi:hypothetical protein
MILLPTSIWIFKHSEDRLLNERFVHSIFPVAVFVDASGLVLSMKLAPL